MNERDYHDLHYAAEARIFASPIFGRVHDRSAADFLRLTGAGSAQRLLSLGCGDGALERRLAPHLGEIVALDISAVAIAQAAGRCAAPNVSFRVWQPEAEPLERLGAFDVVAAFAFLHHLDDGAIRAMLGTARRVLRPGGVFYSSDPSRRRLVGLFRGLVRGAYERHHSPDERELDPETLAALAVDAGFSRPAIGYSDYFLGPLAWLAPGTPGWLAGGLEALDNFARGVPLVRRYASSFSLLARAD